MATISLTRGLVAVVDEVDLGLVDHLSWHAMPGKRDTFYAATSIAGRRVYMHRFLLGLRGRTPLVDHRDGDGLNNRLQNLRIATGTQNNGNRRRQVTAGTPFKGVTFDTWTGTYKAQLMCRGVNHHLGRFVDSMDAARVYDAAARTYFGEFARFNLGG